jgi:O-antigen/teichoic acid export membrane protein
VVFGQVFARTLAAFLFVGLGLCLFAPEAVVLLGGRRYLDAAAFVAPVVLACFFQSASSLMDAGLYVKRRTGLKLAVTLATTAVMLALYVLLIPAHGGTGAALATLGGFAFLALATFVVSQSVFSVRYPWTRLAGMVVLTCGMWWIARTLPAEPWAIAVKAALWLAVLPLAWVSGLVSGDEKGALRDLFSRLIARPLAQGWKPLVRALALIALIVDRYWR